MSVREEIEKEKELVRKSCHGYVHPSSDDRKRFEEWLQDVVSFHLDNLKKRVETEAEEEE